MFRRSTTVAVGQLKKVVFTDLTKRDGAQAYPFALSLEEKATLYEMLATSGVKSIEVGSFSNLPSMANSPAFFETLKNTKDGVDKRMLFMKPEQLKIAIDNHGFRGNTVTAVFSVLDLLSKQNQNCTPEEGINRVAKITDIARERALPVSVYISGFNGYPKNPDGSIVEGFPKQYLSPKQRWHIAERIMAMSNVVSIAPSDTYGTMTKEDAQELAYEMPPELKNYIEWHLHDGMGNGKTYEAFRFLMLAGFTRFHGTLGGIGGCPNAKNPDGKSSNKGNANLLTMVRIAEEEGYEHGLSISGLEQAEAYLKQVIEEHKKSNLLNK